jgi:D-sedoheptulose 7-phosphate isomerase
MTVELGAEEGRTGAATSHAAQYLAELVEIAGRIDVAGLERMAESLARLRAGGGRLFFLGVGGSAANASHATNDFRKLGGFECYCPSDNVAELTARTNDEGWASTFVEYLRVSRLSRRDGVFIFSVGGGDEERNVSPNLVSAVRHARTEGAAVYGIVGRDGGYTARHSDHCIVIPVVNQQMVTPHTEALQLVVSHLLITHPLVLSGAMKWESVTP